MTADAPDGEARNRGGHDAVDVDCLAKKVVEPVHESVLGQRGCEGAIDTTLAPPGTQYGATGVGAVAPTRPAKLYTLASEVSINWVILGQGAQAAKDRELLQATKEYHPDTLRILRWTNTKIKETSPQVLMS